MDTDTMRTADGLSLQSDAGRALSSPTIVELFLEQVVRLARRTALRQPVDGVWQEVSWDEFRNALGDRHLEQWAQLFAQLEANK
jgi:long-subunit acyl-CoA synthetase (AMP-forming)